MRLEHDWPATLIGWDLREREATDSAKKYSPRDSYAHPILVIDLAHELGLTSVLAAAFYDLSRYGPSRIMVGAPRPQSETPLSGAEEQVIASKESYTRLSRSFLYRTFRGREHAQKYVSVFIEKELTTRPISFDCANSAIDNGRSCKDSFYFIMVNTFRSVGGIACGREADPLCTLLHAVEMLSRTDFSNGRKQCGLKICEACKADFAVSVDSARKEVWELIPGWFGLESGRGQSAAYAK